MFCNPVAAFVKAFRLPGSVEGLKLAALAKFDAVLLQRPNKNCGSLSVFLASLRLVQLCHHSERHARAAAKLDDIMQAIDKLDEGDRV